MKFIDEFFSVEVILGYFGAFTMGVISYMSKYDLIEKTGASAGILVALAISIVAFLIQLTKLRRETILTEIEQHKFDQMKAEKNNGKEKRV